MLEGRPFTSWNWTCLNRSYELLHWVRSQYDLMLQWIGPFHAISGSSVFHKEYDRMTFRGFVQICCLVNVVLQYLALPMDWTSGFACVRLVVQSAHRWPGVGLVLGCLQFVVSKVGVPRRHYGGTTAWHWTLGANTSWFLGCMTARRCAKVLAGGSQW